MARYFLGGLARLLRSFTYKFYPSEKKIKKLIGDMLWSFYKKMDITLQGI
jgi:hypothetical protein